MVRIIHKMYLFLTLYKILILKIGVRSMDRIFPTAVCNQKLFIHVIDYYT